MGLLDYTLTKVVLGIALFGLGIAIVNFISGLFKRARENKELREMQKRKEAQEDE